MPWERKSSAELGPVRVSTAGDGRGFATGVALQVASPVNPGLDCGADAVACISTEPVKLLEGNALVDLALRSCGRAIGSMESPDAVGMEAVSCTGCNDRKEFCEAFGCTDGCALSPEGPVDE